MSDPTRRVWRAGPATWSWSGCSPVAAGVVIPVLAYLIYRRRATPWIPGLLVC